MDEILDLYDRAGNPAGTLVRKAGQLPVAPEGTYWRVCDVWIVRENGDILIQRRALTKPNAPGLWCESAGGAILHGETREQGFIRETMEELGVKPDLDRGAMAFEFVGRTSIHDVWVFRMDIPLEALALQKEEVMDAKYVSPAELRRMARAGEFIALGYLEELLRMLPLLTSAY